MSDLERKGADGRPAPIRLGVVYAHTALRQALVRSLDGELGIEVACETDGELVNGQLAELDVLLYVVSPYDRDAEHKIQLVTEAEIGPPVLVLSLGDDVDLALRALRAGAAGFLLAAAPLDELLPAVREVWRGGRYLPPRLQRLVNERFLAPGSRSLGPGVLTRREREVLGHLARGDNNREIAHRLSISVKTIDTHRGNICASSNCATTPTSPVSPSAMA